tara:strand:+ start:15037 stop:15186 length:150 start_codon:yes stop_codon:yes gene_type:complete
LSDLTKIYKSNVHIKFNISDLQKIWSVTYDGYAFDVSISGEIDWNLKAN